MSAGIQSVSYYYWILLRVSEGVESCTCAQFELFCCLFHACCHTVNRAVDRHVQTDSALQGAKDKVLKSSLCLAATVYSLLLMLDWFAASKEIILSAVYLPSHIPPVLFKWLVWVSYFTHTCTLINMGMPWTHLKSQWNLFCIRGARAHPL